VTGLLPPQALTAPEATLWRVCLSNLERFLLPEAGILGRKLTWDGRCLQLAAEPSPRNTAELAKALFVLRARGVASALDPDALMTALVGRYLADLEYQDVALALWADALGGARHLSVLWPALTRRLPEPWQHTDVMFLAWTVSALCHVASVARDQVPVDSLARRLYRRLVRYQHRSTGLFHATGQRRGVWWHREPIASLPVQAFGVQALALFGARLGSPEALRRAETCAEAFCRLQGPKGQFWWTYDVGRGRTEESYPVYAVSQDSGVPAALEGLGLATGHARYAPHVERSLAWVFGNNEVATSLVEEDLGVIWRGIESSNGAFHIIREMHSYHPGRCLYRLASRRTPTEGVPSRPPELPGNLPKER
jgi:hypothetical protein